MSLQIRARHVRTNCCKCKYVGVLCCYLAILTGDSVHFESEPLLWLCIMALHHRISEPKSALLPSGGCRYSFHLKKKRNRKAFIQFQISRGQRMNGQIHVHVQKKQKYILFYCLSKMPTTILLHLRIFSPSIQFVHCILRTWADIAGRTNMRKKKKKKCWQ